MEGTGVGVGAGGVTGAACLVSLFATPLLQTNLLPFLIQVKVLSFTIVFLLRDLQALP